MNDTIDETVAAVGRSTSDHAAHEQNLRTLFNAISESVFLMDRDGRILAANDTFARRLGRQVTDCVGAIVWDLTPADVAARRQAIVERVFQAGVPTTFEDQRQGMWFCHNVWPVVGSDGQVDRLVIYAQDITERVRAEAALREREETYRALLEGLPDIVMRFDPQGRHLFVSENVSQVTALRPEQFIGKTHRELGFAEADCQFWEEAIRRVCETGIPLETEFEYDGIKGRVTFNWRLLPEFDAQGAVKSALSISRDVTAQRRAEREYETIFREMLDGFAVHEIICDAQGNPTDYRFLAVNPAFERMTGLSAQQVVGRRVLEVLPAIERHWIETYGCVALTGEPAFFENYSRSLDKHFQVTAYRTAPGQFACIFSDITERKRSEAERERLQSQLVQAQKMEAVGRLAGGVAHDFNNMLTAILGYAGLALQDAEPGSPLHYRLVEIEKAAQRSADLTRQLLAFARRQTANPRLLDLNEAVAGMLKMLRRLIGEDIELVWIPGHELWRVRIDPSQVDQLLANLAVNARDAITGVGTVTVQTANVVLTSDDCAIWPDATPGEYVLLTVTDDGCGMDAETLEHIFEPFFTTKEKGRGTGLGLATVYGIVTQNGGHIHVHSEPGHGTAFEIYLPRQQAVDTPASPPEGNASSVPHGVGEAVLLVEDELAILNLGKAMLELLGYTVMTATTPDEALRAAVAHPGPIALLITDVVMPAMNGRDLAMRIAAIKPGIKCLYISGYTAEVISRQGLVEEGVFFLPKPFTIRTLADKVREALES